MALWSEEVKKCKVSKQDVLIELIREMKLREKVYTEWIRKGKLKQGDAIKRCAALKLAYHLIKEANDKEVGEQKEIF